MPLKVGSLGFDEVINAGRLKWVVTEEGELLIIPHYVQEQEIAHTVLTNGRPVMTAGEAEIAGFSGQYILIYLTNESGHYQPSVSSLEIAKAAFESNGVIVQL